MREPMFLPINNMLPFRMKTCLLGQVCRFLTILNECWLVFAQVSFYIRREVLLLMFSVKCIVFFIDSNLWSLFSLVRNVWLMIDSICHLSNVDLTKSIRSTVTIRPRVLFMLMFTDESVSWMSQAINAAQIGSVVLKVLVIVPESSILHRAHHKWVHKAYHRFIASFKRVLIVFFLFIVTHFRLIVYTSSAVMAIRFESTDKRMSTTQPRTRHHDHTHSDASIAYE
jgi:hypothetical protein